MRVGEEAKEEKTRKRGRWYGRECVSPTANVAHISPIKIKLIKIIIKGERPRATG